LLLCGCSQNSSPDDLFVKHVQSEYSVGEDSLFVAEKQGRLFIERHTGFQKIRNGKALAPQLKLSNAIFLPSGNGWQDTKTGAVLSFDNDGLLLGSAKYQKVK
jgi:hypothetical protein